MRWREPRAFAAAHHTSRHPHQGGGRPARRRVGGQCRGICQSGGSLIHHAAASAIRALAVAMIQPAFGTLLMAAARGPHRAPAAVVATGAGAVDVPPIAGPTDGEGRGTGPARAEAQRRVHRVAALRAPARPAVDADVPECRRIDAARRSAASVSEGPGVLALGPHLAQLVAYLTKGRRLATAAPARPGRARSARRLPAPLDPPAQPRPLAPIGGYAADCANSTSRDIRPEVCSLT